MFRDESEKFIFCNSSIRLSQNLHSAFYADFFKPNFYSKSIKLMKKILLVLFWGSFLNAFSQNGRVVRIDTLSSKFVEKRTIDVWLPDGYSPKKKYAVLYMHDGQMLFDSTKNWNHQEWRVDETLSQLIKEKKVKDCIVVGIWNRNEFRHSEYFPQKPFESLSQAQQDSIYKATRGRTQALFAQKIQSDNYLKFIVNELKPFIDMQFSTHKDPKNTFIAGSSMGGLISMYAICEYPEVFGGAACLSTHWIGTFFPNNTIPDTFLNYLKKSLPAPSNHKLYFDYGTATLDAYYAPYQKKADEVIQSKGYSAENWITKEFVGEDHSEKAWAKRLSIPLTFLLKK